ncbi:DUF3489 domain-containing protein [Bosea sp. PAMC 26642]|uniref:DUF3489 domain-containing protein n=1 Tax=Bosea sp. (strain PAMC 26642) TaxID=1792307 RepID=UPI00077035F7|nr:DUF3489 domain-containing protein [Bosea sp. PAMC 26642]AMJ61100.1 hypothetical protein AXW83_13075 [Bosea sp. PAMC 26642]
MFRRTRKTISAPPVAQTIAPEPVAVEQTDEAAGTPADVASAEVARLPAPPRRYSKLGIVLGLLQADGGVTLAKLVAVTDWQPHTTRAALTGLRKRGYPIAMEKVVDADGAKRSIYKITTSRYDEHGVAQAWSQARRPEPGRRGGWPDDAQLR